MPTSRTRLLPIGIASLCGLAAAGALSAPAGAAQGATRYLLNTGDAQHLGFSVPAVKATATTNTGQKNCLVGARASYENAVRKAGLVSEVLVCKSTTDAVALFKTATAQSNGASKITPPRVLGGNAAELATKTSSTGVIYWQHGPILEMTALAPVTSSSTGRALTAKQLHVLTAAALRQDSHRH